MKEQDQRENEYDIQDSSANETKMEKSKDVADSSDLNKSNDDKNSNVNIEEVHRNLKYTAFDGSVDIDWDLMKSYIEIQLKNVVDLFTKKVDSNSSVVNSRVENILRNLKAFRKPPFTIQRMCELLILPTKHYRSAENFLFAFNKLVEIDNI
jgi:hypothetical protein